MIPTSRLAYRRPAVTPLLPLIFFSQASSALESPNQLEADNMTLMLITGLLLLSLALAVICFRLMQSLHSARVKLDSKVKQRTESLSNKNTDLIERIARHQETELLLATTQKYYQSILNSLPSLIIGLSNELKVSLWNSAAAQATGKTPEQAIDQDIFALLPGLKHYQQQLIAVIEDEISTVNEGTEFFFDERKCFIDLSIFPLPKPQAGAVILISDVTKRIEVEQFMVQNEKLLSLGQMAAGLAHEINNPLSAVLNNLQNLQRRTSLELPQNQTAARITGIDLQNLQDYFIERGLNKFFVGAREAAERAVAIVNNVLSFAHSGHGAKGPEHINQLIVDVVELEQKAREALGAQMGFEHEIVTHLTADPDICECSPPEIQQVMLNLLQNAIQASEHHQRAANISINTWSDGGFIFIKVTDDGPGINKENLPYIFDPFFTTKGVGEGTGLGLSVSYLIITEHHNGSIEVTSEENQGTSFTIKLPLM
ncbi:two-component system sensor histidine kinase NtrB [Halioxenophilus sp. WMMB6]|uniref:two-component system sensor histidine kinase NtrB n=1 Tax=Halioxenophilus sp. WMMB6 TaxID=3073815 RepID=UPI00295F349A|nr:ATP-binding protein [Halioxenophilus sp. WMMB6]